MDLVNTCRWSATLLLLALCLLTTLPVHGIPGTQLCSSFAELYYANVAGTIKGGVDVIKMGDQSLCSKRSYVDLRYRQLDGRCNHRYDYGSTFKPFKRYLRAHYQDRYGWNTPRVYSVKDGSFLPSPRLLSRTIHPNSAKMDEHTMYVMQLGQLIDHDITSAPVPTETNSSIRCCGVPEGTAPSECFPIAIPEDDDIFDECMEFVRSEPAHREDDGEIIYPREQINGLTSFMDGSAFYGNDEDTLNELREEHGKGALLRTNKVKGKDRLPHNPESECLGADRPGSYCQLAGDKRVNEQPCLGSAHLVFHLEHNRIVRSLAKAILNKRRQPTNPTIIENFIHDSPDYVKEKLFQEARKILGAVFSKITYCDWLPIILGPALIKKFKLSCKRRNKYNPYIDPRIANGFSAAAFRFGHSLIPEFLPINGKKVPLKTQFMIPDESLQAYDSIIMGMTMPNTQETFDRFITKAVTQSLFEPANGKKGKLDLVSLNIQRGRDHGIPGYYFWKRHYRLPRVSSFHYFGEMGPVMSQMYKHIYDIDLFTGGLMEKPVKKGIVGETFGHIIAHQFADMKYGDAYFFQSTNSPQGFTDDELKAIKDVGLASILCHNSEIDGIQKNPFYRVSPGNPYVECTDVPVLDVKPWLKYWG